MRNRSHHTNPHQKDTSGEDLGYAGREQSELREKQALIRHEIREMEQPPSQQGGRG